MPALPSTVGVAVDLAGCPNRCRHCYLGCGPNGKLPAEVLRKAAQAFWSWARPGRDEPFFEQVDVASWYREPDFSGNYRALYDLEQELSRREPRRFELLSVWRLARDPGYAQWARDRGHRVCQITFFGMEELNDRFFRRRRAFRDNLTATQRLLDMGMIPRWQIILTKPGLADLGDLMRLAEELELRRRVADLGGELDIYCHPPAPDGEAWNLEAVRIEESDRARIPDDLTESTRAHCGGRIDWEPEGTWTQRVLRGERIPPYVPDQTWFFLNSDCDVFSNYGELTPAWRLGSFRKDRLDDILGVFERDAAPGLWTAFHVADAELAARFGRMDSNRLYSPGDLRARWNRLSVEEAGQ